MSAAATFPALRRLFVDASDLLTRPIDGCVHLGADRKTGFVCVHHLAEVGLLCLDCSRHHINGHGVEFERSCDGCDKVCLDEGLIAIGAAANGSPSYRIRREDKTTSVYLGVFFIGVGLCNECLVKFQQGLPA